MACADEPRCPTSFDKLERLLKLVQRVLQFALYAQEDAGVAHHGCHSILVARLLVVLEGLVVDRRALVKSPFLTEITPRSSSSFA